MHHGIALPYTLAATMAISIDGEGAYYGTRMMVHCLLPNMLAAVSIHSVRLRRNDCLKA